jgi:hypothetical protein
MSITLEDVETAIKVLQAFLKKQREAESILRKFQAYERRMGGRGFSMDDFVSMAFESVKARREALSQPEGEITEELSEEDLKRIKEIKEKLEQQKK